MKGRTLPTHGVCGGADADEVRRHTPGPGGRVGNEDDSTSAWEFTMVHALMHLPQKQRGIQLVAVRVVEHPFDCPRAQLFDHVRQIVSRLGEGVVRDVRPRAREPFDDAVVFEMPETGNKERSRDARQTPLEFIEVTR